MKRLLTIRIRMLVGLGAGMLAALVQFAGWLRPLEELTIDYRMRMRPAGRISDQIRLVGIGDRDVGSVLGTWPFARSVHADVLAMLNAAGARHCAMDILFTEPSADPQHDRKLVESIQSYKNTTLAYHFESAGSKSDDVQQTPHFEAGNRYGVDVPRFHFVEGRHPVPPFTPIASTFGAVNALPDPDGMIRRVPLFFAHEGRLYPSLAMQTVMAALRVEPDQVHIEPGVAVTLVDTANGTLSIPVDEKCEYRVNFAGDLGVFFPAFQYTDLYSAVNTAGDGGEVFRQLKDRIVLVGNVSTGNADVVNTPIGRIPGVAVQATVVGNILSGTHLRFPPMWEQAFGVVVLCMVLGAMLGFDHPWANLMLILLFAFGWVFASHAFAATNLVLPVVSTLAGLSCTGLAMLVLQMTRVKEDRSRLVDDLGKYVSSALVRNIVEGDCAPPAPSRRRELTIFFSDIRGFTIWVERVDPDEVTLVLNQYFTAMTGIVERYGGTLDKFIGDCIMVFFGEPTEMPDHPLRAVRMAWEMQIEIARLNDRWLSEGRDALHVGMGINTAFVTVGNFGSKDFTDYTVVGRGVNLAARIESWTPSGKILLSARTHALVQDAVQTRLFAELELKGIPEPVPVYELMGMDAPGKASAAVDAIGYWVKDGDGELGPFPLEGIEVMRQCGRIAANTPVRCGPA